MPSWKRLAAHVARSVHDPGGFAQSVRTRGAMSFGRWRLEMMRRFKGETIWRQRGGYWLPFHGDGDLQEVQYQLAGDTWFRAETEYLQRWLPKNGVVIDVGANLGFTALIFSRSVGSSGRVFAFEPSSLVYPKLVEVLEKNGAMNVQCFNLGCGVGRRVETLLVPSSSGNATIRRSGIEPEGEVSEVTIEIDALDNVVLPLTSRVDFLKIDTEGFEDQVLAGANELVQRYRPVIYIELSAEYGESSARAIAWLRERRYRFDREPDLTLAGNGDNFLALPEA